MLTEKLTKHLYPFVKAKNFSADEDPMMAAWEAHMCCKADDIKLESFSIKLPHAPR